MKDDIEKIEKNNSCKLVDTPKNKNIIDTKWVFTKKDDQTFKAWLVAKEFQQKDRLKNTCSPVLKLQTLKLLSSYYIQSSLYMEQMDVETAFLNVLIESKVYASQLEGLEKIKTSPMN